MSDLTFSRRFGEYYSFRLKVGKLVAQNKVKPLKYKICGKGAGGQKKIKYHFL